MMASKLQCDSCINMILEILNQSDNYSRMGKQAHNHRYSPLYLTLTPVTSNPTPHDRICHDERQDKSMFTFLAKSTGEIT